MAVDSASLLEYQHQPVFAAEVLQLLQPKPGHAYIDATFGGGGHSLPILEQSAPDGVVMGIDSNPRAIAAAHQRFASFGSRLLLAHGNFSQLGELWKASDCNLPVNGILFDLGLSSAELADPSWGFSFQTDAPLVMRFDGDPNGGLTAAEVVNEWPEERIEDTLRTYGQEPMARQIAGAIVRQRPIAGTAQLADIVVRLYARRFGRSRRHPATRTFQALRVVVNDEMDVLKRGLAQAEEAMAPGGTLVVISYHSLEDGLAKRFLKANESWQVLTKRPMVPTDDEINSNPRARSAKLRAARKI
jgi:16S rRNA (cytosine1402-N4)-methyltransferase